MAAYVKYLNMTKNLIDGVHNFNSHTFKIALTNTAPNTSTHTVLADITQLSTGGGYTGGAGGGGTTTMSSSTSGGVAKATGTDVTFTASGGSIGPFRYSVLYNDTASSPTDPLISYWDYGSSITLADTETFTVDFNATNGILTVT